MQSPSVSTLDQSLFVFNSEQSFIRFTAVCRFTFASWTPELLNIPRMIRFLAQYLPCHPGRELRGVAPTSPAIAEVATSGGRGETTGRAVGDRARFAQSVRVSASSERQVDKRSARTSGRWTLFIQKAHPAIRPCDSNEWLATKAPDSGGPHHGRGRLRPRNRTFAIWRCWLHHTTRELQQLGRKGRCRTSFVAAHDVGPGGPQ